MGDPQHAAPVDPRHRHERQGLDRPHDHRRCWPRAASRSAPTRAPTSSASPSGSSATASRSPTRSSPSSSAASPAGGRTPASARRRFDILRRRLRLVRRRARSTSRSSRSACGGRWDATNIVDGDVAVVTNVGLDHIEIIGPTRADIAGEKAGIVKPGAHARPGRDRPRARADLPGRGAGRACGAATRLRRATRTASPSAAALLDLRTPGAAYDDVFLPLHGAHQGDNAADRARRGRGVLRAAARPRTWCDEALRDRSRPGPLRDRRAAARSSCSTAPTTPRRPRRGGDARRGVRRRRRPHPRCRHVPRTTDRRDAGGARRPPGPAGGGAAAAVGAGDGRRPTLPPPPSERGGRGRSPSATHVATAVLRAHVDAAPEHAIVLVTGSLYVVGAARRALVR